MRRSGGSERFSKGKGDIPKQKYVEVESDRVSFVNEAFGRVIIERCTSIVVFMKLVKQIQIDDAEIPIINFWNVLEMVMCSVQPTENKDLEYMGEGLEEMQFRPNVLKNAFHHERKDTFCVNKRVILTVWVVAVIRNIPCNPKRL